MTERLKEFRLSTWLILTAILFILVLATFALYIRSEEAVKRAQQQRTEAILLADELRHSSEGMTKMVRSYIVTGNPRFKQYYFDILDIRDGRKSYPRHYHYYWDLAVYGDTGALEASDLKAPLLDMVRDAAFGSRETTLLETAKRNSDQLARMEIEAIRRFETTGPRAAAERSRAKDMLFDAEYDKAKLSILRPISEFNDAMDTRTAAAVEREKRGAMIFRFVFMATSALWFYLLWRTYRALKRVLGVAPAVLQDQIVRLGQEKFDAHPVAITAEKGTVMGWLNETRERLKDLSEAREAALADLSLRTQELADSDARFRAIIEASPVPQALVSPEDYVVYINAAFTRYYGYTLADVPTVADWWPKACPDPVYRAHIIETIERRFNESVEKQRPFQPMEINITAKDGSLHHVIADRVTILRHGREDINLVVFHDISDIKRAEAEVRKAKERLEAAASAGVVGVWDWDVVNDILVWDSVMYKLYGIQEKDFTGAYEAWSATLHPEDKARVEAEMQAALRGEREYAPEFRVIWPDGSIHHLKAVSHTTFDEQGKALRIVGVNYDLTEQKNIQHELDQMAYYDRLTRLPNRRLLEDRTVQSIALAKRENRRMALLFIDLDKFKQVNDQHGHEAGDWLLREVAGRMTQCLRASDTAARIGGDEFIVLLPDAGTADIAVNVAEKIRVSMEQPFVMDDGTELDISSSIGVVLYPEHADNMRDLLRLGDEAMYHAKKGGRNAVRVYAPPAPEENPFRLEGRSLVRLEWKPAFNCGEPTIDREHQELFAIANELLELASKPGVPPEVFNREFDRFLAHFTQHFHDEERILYEWHYPEVAMHAAQHQTLQQRAGELRRQSEQAALPVGKLVEFLATDMLANHLLNEDRKFFSLFGTNQPGA